MITLPATLWLATAKGPPGPDIQSLFDMVMNGGPLMIPIALCSIIALAYIVERSIRLRAGRLYDRKVGAAIVAAVRDGGAVQGALACGDKALPMCEILRAGLIRHGRPPLEIEKAVEDAGYREVKRLSANLRPLMVIAVIAPLLGLLGTVWGMIEAFSSIALRDGLGKPEMLASGISQALITTAAGLVVAIPTQCAYFYFRARIDRFVRMTEDLYVDISASLLGTRLAAARTPRGDSAAGTTDGADSADTGVAHAHS